MSSMARSEFTMTWLTHKKIVWQSHSPTHTSSITWIFISIVWKVSNLFQVKSQHGHFGEILPCQKIGHCFNFTEKTKDWRWQKGGREADCFGLLLICQKPSLILTWAWHSSVEAGSYPSICKKILSRPVLKNPRQTYKLIYRLG